MANQPIHEPKDFSTELRKLEITDPAHANVFNPLFERLVNNEALLREEKLDKNEVAANGASKIPRLNAAGKGAFSITGDAATVGGKAVGTEANQIPTRDANGKLVADQLTRLKITKSGKDANGKFTQVDYKRESDNSKFMRSVLSDPDANGNYQTDTWTYYKGDGATVAETKVWTITYDADGDVTSVA